VCADYPASTGATVPVAVGERCCGGRRPAASGRMTAGWQRGDSVVEDDRPILVRITGVTPGRVGGRNLMHVPRSRTASVLIGLVAVLGAAIPGAASAMSTAPAAVAHAAASPQTPEAVAKATGKRVLIPALTTANSQTYANPDGTRTFEESLVPARQRTASGGWAPVSPPAPTAPAVDIPPPGAGRVVTPGTSAPSAIRPNASTNPGMTGWAEAYANFPNVTYWGGDGTACPGTAPQPLCAKVGLAYDRSVTVRSFFQFDVSGLAGKNIQSAQVSILEAYAPSCSATGIEIYETGPVGPGTTWNAQPSWERYIGTDGHAYGYTGACPRNTIGFDATQAVKDGPGNSGVATFGFKGVGNETDHLSWRKFALSPTPSLIVTYDSPPDVPGSLSQGMADAGGTIPCANHANAPYVATATPSLHATVTDADAGSLVAAHFQWYVAGNFNVVGEATTAFSGSGAPFNANVPAGAFSDGADIAWRVQGVDSVGTAGAWSQWCELYVDITPPSAPPTVTSSVYTEAKPGSSTATFSGGVGQTEPFTFTANGVPDVTGFVYCVQAGATSAGSGQCTPTTYVAANQLGGSATANITPLVYGPNDLFVRSVDRAGNQGPVYRSDQGINPSPFMGYHFLVAHGAPAVGSWHLDSFGPANAGTTAPDSSGNHYDGTLSSSGSYWTAGRINGAVHLDGNLGTAITASPVLNTSQSFAVSAWVKLDHTGPAAYNIVSQDGNQGSGFYLQYRADSGRWVFMMLTSDVANATGDQAIANTPVQTGAWTHLVGEYDSGAGLLKIFVNGQLAGTTPHTTAWNATGQFAIGRDKWNGVLTDPFPGSIDEVRAYQRVLPASPAAGDGAENVHDLATGSAVQQAFLPLNDGSGTNAEDQSGNYDNGTLSGSTQWTHGHASLNAVHFDEATAQVAASAPAVRTDNSFTVSAEVKLDNVDGNWQTLVSEDGQHASLFLLQYNPTVLSNGIGRWSFSVAPSDVPNPSWQTVYSAAVPQAGVWTQLAGVYDAAAQTVSIYVDGALDSTQAVTSPPQGTAGNLVIGRGRQNDTNLAYLGGALDDVHVYTGVAGDQISGDYSQENAHNVPAPPNNYPGSLTSWFQAGVGHFVTSGPVPQGYYVEGQVGMLAPAGAPNTITIYSCHYNGGQFVSADPQCEKTPTLATQLLGTIGSIYTTPPAGVPTQAIYRCVVTGTVGLGDHFVSVDPKCYSSPNIKAEAQLGYVVAYTHLNRYAKTDTPQDHAMASSTLLVSPGATLVYPLGNYSYEGPLGLLTQTAGDIPVYTCLNGSDEFIATSGTCGGGTAQTIAWIGNMWSTPPQATATAQVFDCKMTGSGERFDSNDPQCEGQTVIGPLGYVITQP
jgi:hypothetical protein